MSRKSKPKKEEKPVDFLDTFNQEKVEAPIQEPEDTSYKVKVTHPSLRIRRAPNLQAEIVGLITDQGIYTILDEANGWGKIDENKWIMLSYTQII